MKGNWSVTWWNVFLEDGAECIKAHMQKNGKAIHYVWNIGQLWGSGGGGGDIEARQVCKGKIIWGLINQFEWTPGVGDGQGGLACCNSWGCRVRCDWVTELNWTETLLRFNLWINGEPFQELLFEAHVCFLFFFNFFGVLLLYGVVLVSVVQQSESLYVCMYSLFFGFPFHLGHHRALSRVLCYYPVGSH